jgi:transposase
VKLHGNARLAPVGRDLMCRRVREEGWTVAEAAEAAGCSERTCYRWLARFDAGQPMTDRSSAPRSVPGRTPVETEAVERAPMSGPVAMRVLVGVGWSRPWRTPLG